MSSIKFKVVAKTDVGLIRTNNEDNFQISWDLSSLPMRWINNEVHQLGEKGCLLIIADGMGGANAGEVASQIAIDAIKSQFYPENITPKILSSNASINSFIKDSIEVADEKIKEYAKSHPETIGMGTTIVIAWILGKNLYVGWCGDSRGYVFNQAFGLIRLTKDHSYVQQLVDAGKLSEEEAFDFPDSNIITQCLSASPQKCLPETLAKPFELSNNDIVVLCTDGLCGMVRDSEIASILSDADDNLTKTSESLIDKALSASGADNVTLCLFQPISGLAMASPHKPIIKSKRSVLISVLVGLIIVFITAVILIMLSTISQDDKSINAMPKESSVSAPVDTTSSDSSALNESSANSTVETMPTENPKLHEHGNGKNLLNGLQTGQIPNTDAATEDPEKESEIDVIKTPEIIVVKIPANKSLRIFLKEYGMNQTDFKKLNPGVDPNKTNSGDEIKVYKRK